VAKYTSKRVKEELKQPDEFVSFWTRAAAQAQQFAVARKRALIVGASMLATVVAGSLVFSAIAESRAQKATETLTRIEKLAAADLRPEGAPATNPDGTPLPDDGVPHFKTEKERAEAALKDLDAFLAGSRNPLSVEGRLQRGPLLLALGRAPEAITTYEDLLREKLDPSLRFLAREGLGYAQEAKGDLDAAAATFGKLTEDAGALKEGGFYADRAVYHKARLAELRGNAGDAKRLYKEVLDKNPSTSLRDEISNRLAVLELK
jgi:tetratricopeptide (TPR) repeat protein